jgi:hypothetical protein
MHSPQEIHTRSIPDGAAAHPSFTQQLTDSRQAQAPRRLPVGERAASFHQGTSVGFRA